MVRNSYARSKKEKNGESHQRKSAHHEAPSTSSSLEPKRVAQPLDAKLQEAVVEALFGSGGGKGSGKDERSHEGKRADEYGHGSPTDRLQFGYSPSIADEAVSFHQRISPSEWVAERRRLGKLVFSKHQKLPSPNCEPFSSCIKLRDYWKKQSKLHPGGNAVNNSAADTNRLEQLLEMFASKQRM